MCFFNKSESLTPNFTDKNDNKKNLEVLAIIEAKIKVATFTLENPLVIVTSLYGIGVNPFNAIIQKPYLLKPLVKVANCSP